MNNLQQCEQYKKEIQDKIDNYIKDLGLSIPDEFYGVNYKEVVLIKFETVTYFERGLYGIPDLGKRPSGKLKAEVKSIYDKYMLKEFKEENIRIHMKVVEGKFKSSWADNLIDYKNNNYSTNKEQVQKRLNIETEEYNKIYLAKEGQFNCAYCGKATDNDKKVKREIIFRTRNSWGKACIGEKINDYCSGTCGAHDQMGHEG